MLKRFSIHVDPRDMAALARLAREESEYLGTPITVASLIRRLIREHVRAAHGREERPKRKPRRSR